MSPSLSLLTRTMIGPIRVVRRAESCDSFRRRRRCDPAWLQLWRVAEQTAKSALDSFLDHSAFSEPRVVRDVLHQLPDDALCVIGSSMPIRDADVTMPPRRGLRVLCNRGRRA